MKQRLLLFALASVCISAFATVAPVNLSFGSQSDFDSWTVINANGDDYQWEYDASSQAAHLEQNKSKAYDDWLISPAIQLSAGKAYTITFNVKNCSSFNSDKQTFSINAGWQPTIEGMSEVLAVVTGFTKTAWGVDRNGTFSPATDGEYYFAIRNYSSSYMGDMECYYLKIEEITPYPLAVTDIKAEAAPLGELAANISWTWPVKNDAGGDIASDELKGAYVYRGTSSSFIANESSLVGTSEGGAPGSQGIFVDTTVPQSGKYYYKVIPFTEAGPSKVAPVSAQSDFIGMATSLNAVKNVVAAIADGTERTIHLTWDAPTASEGYLDPSLVSYKITRKGAVNSGSVTLEDTWTGELPYVDEVPGGDSYTYTVYTVFNGSTAWSGTSSNAVSVVTPLDLPYSEDFSDSSSVLFYTFFHGADCTRDWKQSSGTLNYWGNPADAWAVTPKFNMQAGKAYKLSFTARVSKSTSPKDLYVYFGAEPTVESLSPNQIFYKNVTSAYATEEEKVFSVPEDGAYNLAFRCYGPSDSNDIYVDDVELIEIVTVPEAAADLEVRAADMGELKALVSWTNPAKDNAGGELTGISKVVVKRGGEPVAEIVENLVPGAVAGYTDIVPEAGKYTYTVSVFDGENESEPVSAESPWIGLDVPKAPVNVAVTIDEDGSRVISFDAVATGVNDGYVGSVAYTVSRNDVVLVEDLEETIYTDNDADLPLAKYVYGIKAVNEVGESELALSEGMILGDAIQVPYEPDFADAGTFDLWTFSHETENRNSWKHNVSKSCLEASSAGSWAFTPKLVIYPGEYYVKGKFTCWSARYEEDLEIWLCKNPEASDPQTVRKIADVHVSSVSYPSEQVFPFSISEAEAGAGDNEDEGLRAPARAGDENKYYIGYKLTSGNMTAYMHQAHVGVTVVTGIDAVEVPGVAVTDGMLVLPDGCTARIFTIDGRHIATSSENYNLDRLAGGTYVIVCTDADGNATTMKYLH